MSNVQYSIPGRNCWQLHPEHFYSARIMSVGGPLKTFALQFEFFPIGSLRDREPYSFGMRSEFRGIHALYGCYPVAKIACVRDKEGVFEYICSFAQIIKEKICTGIFRALIVA